MRASREYPRVALFFFNLPSIEYEITKIFADIMNVRFRFKSAKLAEECAKKLPVACSNRLVTDRTSDVYLEVPEDYEDYVERYLYTPYREQSI